MNDQIIDITFTINGRVQLDIARAEEDPYWEQLSRGLDMTDPTQFQLVIRNYVSAYLRNEQLLGNNAPWTCGPSSIYSVQIDIKEEVKNGRNSTSAGN